MKKSECLYVDVTDDKDKMKLNDSSKNKIINSLVGKYDIKEVTVSVLSIDISYNGPINESNIKKTARKINDIYGNRDTYISALKNKNNFMNYSVINKNEFTYFKKSDNVEIPDVDFYVYGYGELPLCN